MKKPSAVSHQLSVALVTCVMSLATCHLSLAQSQMTYVAGAQSVAGCMGGDIRRPCNAKTDLAQTGDPWLIPISSISGNASTITVTTSTAHGLSTGASVYIAGVYTGTGTNGQTDYNTFGTPATITVTSPTQFTYAGSTASTYVSGGYVVTQMRPLYNQPFVDPLAGAIGVRITFKDMAKAVIPAGSDGALDICGGAGPCANGLWCKTPGAGGTCTTQNPNALNYQQFYNTNAGANVGMIGTYCPPSGSVNGYSCWNPGKYNIYVDQVGASTLKGGGASLVVFDPVAMHGVSTPVGGTSSGPTFTGFAESAVWSQYDPDTLFFPSVVSGVPEIQAWQVHANSKTPAFIATHCNARMQSFSSFGVNTFSGGSYASAGVTYDRYLGIMGGGIYQGTPNESGGQELWSQQFIYDRQTGYCIDYDTVHGTIQIYDTGDVDLGTPHAIVAATVTTDPYQTGNPPTAQTPAPAGVGTITQTAGGPLTPGNTYYVKETYGVLFDNLGGLQGESLPSPETSVTLAAGNHGFTVASPAAFASTQANADVIVPARYSVYVGTTPGGEVSQTPLIFGPTPVASPVTSGGSLADGAYDVIESYIVSAGGATNVGGETSSTPYQNGSYTCVVISGGAGAGSISVTEPAAAAFETSWRVYLATHGAATCATGSPNAFTLANGNTATFARGSGPETISTLGSTTAPLIVRNNQTGAVALTTTWSVPSGGLATTSAPPTTSSAGFSMHEAILAPSGQYFKSSANTGEKLAWNNQPFDVWSNVLGTFLNGSGACGTVDGPDGTAGTACGGHPTQSSFALDTNVQTGAIPMLYYLRPFSNFLSVTQLNQAPAFGNVDMHQSWLMNSASGSTPECQDMQQSVGDDGSNAYGTSYNSGWTLNLRGLAWLNEMVCIGTSSSLAPNNPTYRLFRVHGESFGSALTKANPLFVTGGGNAIAALDTCSTSYDGKLAICGSDWYGNMGIPMTCISNYVCNPCTPSTTCMPANDDVIWKLQ